jgi:hypothetical protein
MVTGKYKTRWLDHVNLYHRHAFQLPRTFIPAVGMAPYTVGNGALNDQKRRFTALIFTLFHRNPSVRITTAVSGRLRAVLLDLGAIETAKRKT